MPTETISTYDGIALQYAETASRWIPKDKMGKAVGLTGSDSPKVLDVGCAVGAQAEVFATEMNCNVVAIDPSEALLNIAQTAHVHEKVTYLKAGMEDLPISGEKFDLVWASAVFHHQDRENMVQTLRNFHGSLEPNGVLFLSTKKGTGVDTKVHEEIGTIQYTLVEEAELLQMLIEAGFEILEVEKDDDTLGRPVSWITVYARAVHNP